MQQHIVKANEEEDGHEPASKEGRDTNGRVLEEGGRRVLGEKGKEGGREG